MADEQDIDTITPTGRLVFHILGAIDEFKCELIVEDTARAWPGPGAVRRVCLRAVRQANEAADLIRRRLG